MCNTPYTDAHLLQACLDQLQAGEAPAIPSEQPEQHSPFQTTFQAAWEEAELLLPQRRQSGVLPQRRQSGLLPQRSQSALLPQMRRCHPCQIDS